MTQYTLVDPKTSILHRTISWKTLTSAPKRHCRFASDLSQTTTVTSKDFQMGQPKIIL